MGDRFVEVHARASVEERARHDVQGLYEKRPARRDRGVHRGLPPLRGAIAPEVLLYNEVESPDESARNALAFIEQASNRRRVRASVG